MNSRVMTGVLLVAALSCVCAGAATTGDSVQADFNAGTHSDTIYNTDRSSLTLRPRNAGGELPASTPGLQLLLRMNDKPAGNGTMLADSSGNGRHTPLTNNNAGPNNSVGGVFGNAISFDGNGDFALVPSSYQLGGAFTVEAWVFCRDPYANWSRIIDFGNGPGTNNVLIAFPGNSGRVFLEVYRQGQGSQAIITDDVFPRNQWAHLVCTLDNNTAAAIYINGVAKATGSVWTPVLEARANQFIARSNWADADFNGNMDEFAMYNRALTAAEVLTHYQAGSGAAAPNPPQEFPDGTANNRVLYHMNGASATNGSSIADTSGNGNNGILNTFDASNKAVTGRIGNGINFDGVDDHIIVPPTYQITPGFSYEGWIYARNPYAFWNRAFDFGNGPANDNVLLAWAGGSGLMRYEVYLGGGFAGGINTSTQFPRGRWVHVALTHAPGGEACIYWNGVLQASGFVPPPNVITRNSQFLGRSNWPDALFDGQMDEVLFHNVALSPAQVFQHYTQQSPSFPGTSTFTELPDNNSTGGFTSMAGNTMLLHMNAATVANGGAIADSSGNAVPVSMVTDNGGDNRATLGHMGNGINFDGANDFALVDSSRQFGGAMTVEAWVLSRNPFANWSRIIDFANGAATNNIVVAFPGGSGQMWLEVYRTGQGGGGIIVAPQIFPTNEWVHVVATLRPIDATFAEGSIYWNGVLQARGQTFLPVVEPRSQQFIGRSNWFPGDVDFNGIMDEVALYNRVLTEAEISRHYYAQSTHYTTPSTPGELPDNASGSGNTVLYHMNQNPTDGVVVDSSGNNFHGMLGSYNGLMNKAAPGVFGSGLNFDGVDDFVNVSQEYVINGATGFSAEAWVYNRTPRAVWARLFDFGNGPGSDNILVTWPGDTGRMAFYTFQGGNASAIEVFDAFPQSQWVHVAVTLETSGFATIYWNGVAKATGFLFIPNNLVRTQQFIGRSNWADALFNGVLDEVAFYNRALSAAEVAAHVAAAPAASFPTVSGTFDSRIFDGTAARWQSLAWSPERPEGKELPNSGASEGGYSSGNANMNNNVVLLHMNEASISNGSVLANTSIDTNTATYISDNGGNKAGAGKFNGAATFDGNGDYINISSSIVFGGTPICIEAWVNSSDIFRNWARVCDFGNGAGNNNILISQFANTGRIWFEVYGNGGGAIVTNDVIPQNQWVHICAMTDGSPNGASIYLNGELKAVGTVAIPPTVVRTGQFVGRSHWFPFGDADFAGAIDEFGVYARTLSAQEVLDHYRRGAENIRFQVRTSDDPAMTGATFVGPDGTANTFYSELANATLGTPSFTIAGTPISRYLQYRATLSTQNTFSPPDLRTTAINYSPGPTDITLSASTVAENQAAGTVVGTLSAAGGSGGNVFSLVAGTGSTDNASFQIVGTSLQTAAPLDFETTPVCSIRVRVTDSNGIFYNEVMSITVTDANDAPVLAPIGDLAVDEGATLSLTAAATDVDVPSQSLSYSLVGAPAGASITPGGFFSYTPADGPASPTVTIVVTDDGVPPMSDSETITINVANVAPTLIIAGAGNVDEGSEYTLSLASSDPGVDSITQWQIDWGDGSVQTIAGNPSSATHTYPDGPNGWTIIASVTDDDSPVAFYAASNTVDVSVNNIVPQLTISGPSLIIEDDVYTLNLSSFDPGTDTITNWRIDWGDGNVEVFAGNPSTATHIYPTPNIPDSFAIVAQVTDDDSPGTFYGASNTVLVTVDWRTPTATFRKADIDNEAFLGAVLFENPSSLTAKFSYDLNYNGATPNFTYGFGDGTADGSVTTMNVTIPPQYITTNPNQTVLGRIIEVNGYHTDYLLRQPDFQADVYNTIYAEGEVGDSFSYTFSADGEPNTVANPITYTVTVLDLPVGITSLADVGLTYDGVKTFTGTLLQAGQLTMRVKASNLAGISYTYFVLTIKRGSGSNHPRILSAPFGNPNPAIAGKTVTFSVVAEDVDGDLLSYFWDFGDGTNARGRVVEHVYTASGSFDVVVVVSDGGRLQDDRLTMKVLSLSENTYNIASLKLSLDFKTATRSSLIVTGKLPVPDTYIPAGSSATVTIQDSLYTQTFNLNSKGVGGDTVSLFSITVAAPGKTSSLSKFTLHLKSTAGTDPLHPSLAQMLAPLGFINKSIGRPGEIMDLPLIITLNTVPPNTQVSTAKVNVTCVKNKKLTGKLVKQ